MVMESITCSQLDTCSSAEGMAVEYSIRLMSCFFFVFLFFFHLVPAMALYYISFVAIQHECPTSRLCTGQDQGGIILGFLYPIAECVLRLILLSWLKCRHGIFFLHGLHSCRMYVAWQSSPLTPCLLVRLFTRAPEWHNHWWRGFDIEVRRPSVMSLEFS